MMLQQILNDLYIDPELLGELDEEQKQILFCKMREEQVRRWKIREDMLDEEEEKKKRIMEPKTSGKKVTFLVGMDGEPVVVVMGEGGEVDSLLQERARRQTELETDQLKRAAEEELDKLVRLSRSTVKAMEEEAARNNQNKARDPAREAVVKSLQEATVEMEKQIKAMEDVDTANNKKNTTSSPPSPTTSSAPPSPSSPTSSSSSGIGSMKLFSSPSSSSLSSLSSNSSSASLPSPPAFSISSYGSNNYGSSPRKLNGINMWETSTTSSSKSPLGPTPTLNTAKPVVLAPKPGLAPSLSHPTTTTTRLTQSTTTNGRNHTPSPPSSLSSTASTMSSLSPSPPPSLSSPTTTKVPPVLTPLTIIEKDDLPELAYKTQDAEEHAAFTVGVAAQIRRWEQLSEGSLEALKTATLERAKKRRQREILEHLRSQVEAAKLHVQDTASKMSLETDSAWQEQERKAKEAERRIREIARRAREEHRRASTTPHTPVPHAINTNLNALTHATILKNGINGTTNGMSNGVNSINGHTSSNGGDINGNIKAMQEDVSNNNKNSTTTSSAVKGGQSVGGGCVRQRLRPPKPPSRGAIVQWFREDELPRGAGLEPSRMRVAPWFHGIISRSEAEEVLAGAEVGCFLVRVSERIWGYAISYRAPDRCRHYLIDVTGGKYTFFGSHQASHDTLGDLIEYHTKEPITAAGGELLTRPCGQPNPRRPDYLELFTGTQYLVL